MNRFLNIAGWLLIGLSIFSGFGHLNLAYPRPASIEEFLDAPNLVNIGGTIGYILGANLMNIVGLVCGIVLMVRKYSGGLAIVFIGCLSIIFITIIQFLPGESSELHSETAAEFEPVSLTTPDSRFVVNFPHPYKKRIGDILDKRILMYESNLDRDPYLRVEFHDDFPTPIDKEALHRILVHYGHQSGIPDPQFTVSMEHYGMIGTYSGIKTLGGVDIKVYGKIYVSGNSLINCLVCENSYKFPSMDSGRFLDGVSLKE